MPATSQTQQRLMAISPQYVAGFLDGEGNITILARNQKGKYACSYGLHVGFTNRDLRPLLSIKAIYGGSLFAKRLASPRHSQAFELRIGNRIAVKSLLCDVLPFLICKKAQAELGLSFLALGKCKMIVVETRRIHPLKGGAHSIMHAAPGEQEARDSLKCQLMILNKRGAA